MNEWMTQIIEDEYVCIKDWTAKCDPFGICIGQFQVQLDE